MSTEDIAKVVELSEGDVISSLVKRHRAESTSDVEMIIRMNNCFVHGVNSYAKGVQAIVPVAKVVKWCGDVLHEVLAKTKLRYRFNQAQKLPQFADFHKRHGYQVVGARKPKEFRAVTWFFLVGQTFDLLDILSYLAGDLLVVRESQTFVNLMQDEAMKTRCQALHPVAEAICMTKNFCDSIDEGLGLVKSQWDKMLVTTHELAETWDLDKHRDELWTLEDHLESEMFTPIVSLATLLHPVNLATSPRANDLSLKLWGELHEAFLIFFADTWEADQELTFLLDHQGTFGQEVCWTNAGTEKEPGLPPSQWWSLYGGEVPCLRKMGLHCSGLSKNASGPERVWGDCDRACSGRWNRLGTNAMEKVVFVAGALRNVRKLRKGVKTPLPAKLILGEEDREVALAAAAREDPATGPALEADLFEVPPAEVMRADAFQQLRKRKYPSASVVEEKAAALCITHLTRARVQLEGASFLRVDTARELLREVYELQEAQSMNVFNNDLCELLIITIAIWKCGSC
jgi:hypothetical protein